MHLISFKIKAIKCTLHALSQAKDMQKVPPMLSYP